MPIKISLPLLWWALQEDAHTQFPEQGRFLKLQALSTADGGDYSCTARNTAGSTSVAFHVEIHSECPPPYPTPAIPSEPQAPSPALCSSPAAPTIQPGPTAVDISVNRTALLPCQAHGVPTPLMSWRKNGVLLDPGNPRWEPEGEGFRRILVQGLLCLSHKKKLSWAVGTEK